MDQPRDSVLVSVPLPGLFEPGQKPKFLREGRSSSRPSGTPREVPRSVAAAAAVALAGPRAAAAVHGTPVPPLGSARRKLPYTGDTVPWPPRLGSGRPDVLQYANDSLDLVRDARCNLAPEVGGALRFGDPVRITLEGGRPAALAVLPPRCGSMIEEHLAAELSGSGREPSGFVAVTATPVFEDVDAVMRGTPLATRRNAWELHRANPLDGFPADDSVVHYGQLLRIGQRSSFPGGDEMLLSCEPPKKGAGVGEPYMILGRFSDFGRPGPTALEDERKANCTLFRFLQPEGPDPEACEGRPVDLRRPVLIVPVAPFAYLHGPRFLRVCPSVGAPDGGHLCPNGRTVQTGGGRAGSREALLEAAVPWINVPSEEAGRRKVWSSIPTLTGWLIEPLVLPVANVIACERRRQQAHSGLARALLGRNLECPPPDIGSAPSVTGQETRYARWEHLRGALLPRIRKRGPLAFALFRKALVAVVPAASIDAELSNIIRSPGADEPPPASERYIAQVGQVAVVLDHDYGIRVSQDDLQLLAEVFAAGGSSGSSAGGRGGGHFSTVSVDVDVLADELRGEPSPGRHAYLARLYTELQREDGVASSTSLVCGRMEARLWRAVPAEVPDAPRPEHLPAQLMNALPFLSAHDCIKRAIFVRWMGDLCFHISSHSAFVARMQEIWGELPGMADLHEERNWSFRMRAAAPAPLHHPPFIGGFPPITAPVEAASLPGSASRGRGASKS